MKWWSRIVNRIAADTVFLAENDKGIGQYSFKAGPRDDTGRERMVLDYDRHFGKHRLHAQPFQIMSVQDAIRRECPVWLLLNPMTERVFAADVKSQVFPHRSSVGFQEADKTTQVVQVPVAQDQRVERRRVDLQQLQVVAEHIRSEAEVQQITAGFRTLGRNQMERQAPLAFQRPAVECGRGTHPFDPDTRHLFS